MRLPPFLLRRMLSVSALLALLGGVPAACGEPVVIVNRASGVEKLTRDEVTNIFMGRQKRLPSGIVALRIEQNHTSSIRARFYELLLGKDESEINAYWARLLFSGQAQPPQRADSAQEVLKLVASNIGAIGVIDGAFVNPGVRVVLEFRD
jgi:ABC-type phosphate transport system substrate-binding protein